LWLPSLLPLGAQLIHPRLQARPEHRVAHTNL
jgi:hypothetical protein